jgi:hypothetical protein
MCREALPPRAEALRRRNPRGVTGVAVVVADSPAGPELRRLRFHRRPTPSGHESYPGEFMVSSWSPWTPSRAPSCAEAPSPWSPAGARHGWGCPGHSASVAWRVGLGPLCLVTMGHYDPCTKSLCAYFVNSRNFRICVNLVKCIVNYLFIRKLCIICQNAQKNELYLFVSLSCIDKQLEPCLI